MTEIKRRSPASDRPPEDLKKERDAFIEQFFRKGAQFTEELLGENKRLLDKVAELEAENGKLRAHLASDAAIRDLLTKIEELEREKKDLINRSSELEGAGSNYVHRFEEVEDELSNLANLYVATTQLYSAHTVRALLRTLKELLGQFLGGAGFAIYLASDDRKELIAIASEGVSRAEIARLSATAQRVGETFSKGELFFDREADTSKGTVERPAAVIPLKLGEVIIGVIVIFATLTQKTEFGRVDSELFKLLGDHAGSALVSARLLADAGRKLPSVQAYLDAED
ncbi:MAG: GAF domain-containing protein [Polyangiaceae bacterium]|nr:GAF domain-containing protein [Polyangiaceae bacterium]